MQQRVVENIAYVAAPQRSLPAVSNLTTQYQQGQCTNVLLSSLYVVHMRKSS